MANQKEKRGILLRFYKKVSGVLFILAALYCLPKSGLIAWRNKRDHHLAYLYHLLKDALDQNHVKKGFLALKDEFLFHSWEHHQIFDLLLHRNGSHLAFAKGI